MEGQKATDVPQAPNDQNGRLLGHGGLKMPKLKKRRASGRSETARCGVVDLGGDFSSVQALSRGTKKKAAVRRATSKPRQEGKTNAAGDSAGDRRARSERGKSRCGQGEAIPAAALSNGDGLGDGEGMYAQCLASLIWRVTGWLLVGAPCRGLLSNFGTRSAGKCKGDAKGS